MLKFIIIYSKEIIKNIKKKKLIYIFNIQKKYITNNIKCPIFAYKIFMFNFYWNDNSFIIQKFFFIYKKYKLYF